MNSEYFDSFFTQVVLENSALHIYGRFRHAVPDAVSIRAFRESGGFGLKLIMSFPVPFLRSGRKRFVTLRGPTALTFNRAGISSMRFGDRPPR